MPITPFHFGPGAALHAIAQKHVSFLTFCAANVLMDVEPLYFMLTHQYPIHRVLHTYAGATLVVLATAALFFLARRCVEQIGFLKRLPRLLQWRALGSGPVWLGAIAGSYSHVFFDSFMHADMTPLSPFSNANPLLHVVPLAQLHWFCIGAGVAALAILGLRRVLSRRT